MPLNFAKPKTITTSGMGTIDAAISWMTVINSGAAAGSITFTSTGDSISIGAGESLTLPYTGRPYDDIDYDGTGTTLKIIFMN